MINICYWFDSSLLSTISFLSLIDAHHLLLSITWWSSIWYVDGIIMGTHCSILLLRLLGNHVSWTAACWLFLYYFWWIRSKISSIACGLASWIWNLNIITIMTLMLLKGLRISCALWKSIILGIIVHNHLRLKWLIYYMRVISLSGKAASSNIPLEWLMHKWLRAKVGSWWNLLLCWNFSTWRCDWSTYIHRTWILSDCLVLRATSMSINSWGINSIAKWSAVSIVINHTVSMSLAT